MTKIKKRIFGSTIYWEVEGLFTKEEIIIIQGKEGYPVYGYGSFRHKQNKEKNITTWETYSSCD